MKKIALILLAVFLLVGCGSNPEPQGAPQGSQAEQSQEDTGGQAEESVAASPEVPGETLSQKNAVSMAKDYLNYTAFSRSGLIEQLKFEGFDDSDAAYAVDKLKIDWKEQAARMAQDYLDYMSFSRNGLIEQLEFEGFNKEDATYAVGEVGF